MLRATDSVESADGTRIVFHLQGDGPPLVVLHGTLVTTDMYQDLADMLASRYRVVLVERRDYGPSGTGPRPAGFSRQAADLAAVLTVLDEPAFIFGHSIGGLVALHAMRETSSVVRRLALYEPPVALAGPVLAPPLAKIQDLMISNRPEEAIIEFFSAISDSAPQPGTLEPIAAMLAYRATGLVADLECITAMEPDMSRWSSLDTQTLLLVGENTDSYGRKSVDLLHATLPNAHLVTLAGQGHHPDDPVPLAAALSEFFS
ncbi:alpha/beta hydrolase [Nocardia sp. NEAU-G5]|uniref:Alpha/beta hydrolase n=1 Tax=Nocardia albiluteola TaxID=2842303 RepID=A0ABS6AWA5_9NOCA|nr:alpha/beta hydrolase [Nocardia albiluteola]MBU3062331.1 alpha/beta hydrolase [Nocardia albiluteola]